MGLKLDWTNLYWLTHVLLMFRDVKWLDTAEFRSVWSELLSVDEFHLLKVLGGEADPPHLAKKLMLREIYTRIGANDREESAEAIRHFFSSLRDSKVPFSTWEFYREELDLFVGTEAFRTLVIENAIEGDSFFDFIKGVKYFLENHSRREREVKTFLAAFRINRKSFPPISSEQGNVNAYREKVAALDRKIKSMRRALIQANLGDLPKIDVPSVCTARHGVSLVTKPRSVKASGR